MCVCWWSVREVWWVMYPEPRHDQYNKCKKPDCLRKVKPGIVYCCAPCGVASEKKYEVHEGGLLGHTEWCNERAAQRGLLTIYDWQYYT